MRLIRVSLPITVKTLKAHYYLCLMHPRRPRPRNCRCDDCCSTNFLGIAQPPSVLRSHLKKQQIRDRFKVPLPNTSASGAEGLTGSGSDPLGSVSPGPSESNTAGSSIIPPLNNPPSPKPNVTSENEVHSEVPVDSEGWLEEMKEEIDIRLTALQERDLHLEFNQPPMSSKPFIFPDPESILKANSGPFALAPTCPNNCRFLETEARFCSLLTELHLKPLDAAKRKREMLEDLLYTALEKLHQMKMREWELQASPELSEYIFNNGKS